MSLKLQTSNFKLQSRFKVQPSTQKGYLKFGGWILSEFWILKFGVLFIACSLAARAATFAPSAFDAANQLYYEGKFADAASSYEKLVQAGEKSPALYFNLGNALFKSGQIGRAIAAYRQGERLAPRDPDIRANLRFARNQVQGSSAPSNPWQKWLATLTLNEWSLLAAASVWTLFLLLALVQWKPDWKRGAKNYIIVSGLAALFLCCCLGAAAHERNSGQSAIIIAPEVIVRLGPLDSSANKFIVHDGAELEVLDRREDWLQVSAGPQRIGWVRREQVVVM
jgi:tetratricopeptide (TPR) repeat protein